MMISRLCKSVFEPVLFAFIFTHVCLVCFLDGGAVFGQSVVLFKTAELQYDNVVLQTPMKDFKKKNTVLKDSVSLKIALRAALEKYYSYGYLEARFDSTLIVNDSMIVWCTLGKAYKWISLQSAVGKDELSSGYRLNTRIYNKKNVDPASFANLTKEILDWSSQNGYPFAQTRLDSVRFIEGGIEAVLKIDKGPLLLLDSVEVRGDARVSRSYLMNYLELHPGDPFNEKLLEKISVRLKEIPFLTEARTSEIAYFTDRARPILFLKQKKASQFNGVVGLQPDNSGTGKVFVTGDIRLRLHNSFGKAELLDLNWSNPQPGSQDLRVKTVFPFLFSLPIGVEGELTLYKKDSTFLELNRQIGFRYYLGGANSFRLILGRKSSKLISTGQYRNAQSLPSYADVSTGNFGLGMQFTRLDYRLNPRRGFAFDLNASAGIRAIDRNSALPESLYDGIQLRSSQYRAEITADTYLPLGGRGVVNLGCMGAWLQADPVFSNELYRIGGLRTLRGFDEQSIFASSYVIGKTELRYILEQNSYLLLFFNYAWYEDRSGASIERDTPFGYGAGITFETKLGIFSFTYALGSQKGNPVEFRLAKVHFGLINYF